MSWQSDLRRASFRGVPFGVLEGEKSLGRKIALHEYPYRDTPWAEDLGKKTRRHRITGFLLANDIVTGGGDVIAQRNSMEAAAETQGQATLVHPTLGSLQVTLLELTTMERWDNGRYFELRFDLVEGGGASLTQVIASFLAALGLSAIAADIAAAAQFVQNVQSTVQDGISMVQGLQSSFAGYSSQIAALSFNATNLFGSLSALPGNNGRFASGGASGYLQTQPTDASTTVATLVAAAAANRAAVATAATAVQTAIGGLGDTTEASDVANAVQAHVAALAAACSSPSARIALLVRLANYTPPGGGAATTSGQALAVAYQCAAATALARAGTTYQPSSYNDALAVRATITAVLDAQIDVAGDTGADQVFATFRDLRQNVVSDLNQRGAALPQLAPAITVANLPDVVLAMKLYGDPSRADGLVIQGDPRNPLFMPTNFLALVS